MSESEVQYEDIQVFLFDRDDPSLVEEVTEDDQYFRSWGNNVFSAVLPPPTHRDDVNISIELYYKNDDLLKKDQNGRRIFLGQEFHHESGKLKEKPIINTKILNKTGKKNKIIDSYVFNENSESIALSKSDFAENILESIPPFESVDFSHFKKIFDILSEIEERIDR